MKHTALIAILLVILASCSRTTPPANDQVKPRILQNFTDTSDLEHVNGAVFYTTKDSSLVYSKVHSFYNVTDRLDKAFSVAGAAMPKTGGTFTGNTWVQNTGVNKVLIAMNLSSTTSTANNTFGPTSYYLGLGHREYGANTYRLIGFGFRYTGSDHYPAVLGYQETNGGSSTLGDLIFATRSVTSNTASTVRLRVTGAGSVKSYGTISANEDVATKGYVDTAYKRATTFNTTTVNLVGTPSGTFITNNASSSTTYTLPPVKAGANYSFWKVQGIDMVVTGGPIADVGKVGTKITSLAAEKGATISFTCNGANWVVTSKNGTWKTE